MQFKVDVKNNREKKQQQFTRTRINYMINKIFVFRLRCVDCFASNNDLFAYWYAIPNASIA